MSVRMALSKLCACACGGALIGGGAMHATDHSGHGAHTAHYGSSYNGGARHHAVLAHGYSHARLVRVADGHHAVRRIKRTVTTTTTQMACAPQRMMVASRGYAPDYPDPGRETGMGNGGSGGGGICAVLPDGKR